MLFKGYKIRIRCIEWEQVSVIDNFWELVAIHTGYKKIIGLGMNWVENGLYFDYALGVIDDEKTFQKLKSVIINESNLNAEYCEINLPSENEWITYKGKNKDVKDLYEKNIDCYNKRYDYELEYIDGLGNIEIKIHYIK